MEDESPWLSDEQQRVWRRWLTMNAELQAAIQRDLQTGSGLSAPDFSVLVVLTDTPEGRVRVSDLATVLQWDRSRLSHHVKRMAGRELVTRQECAVDGRGAFIAITPAGREAIARAAPGHARLVKHLVFEGLSPDELVCLSEITENLLRRVREASDPATTTSA